MGKSTEASLKAFATSLVNSLKSKTPKESGRLAKSIGALIKGDDIDIMALPYLMIVDKGINGVKQNNGSPFGYSNKKPPIDSLRLLANKIGTSPFALQTSIFENGYKGEKFIDSALNQGLNKGATDIAQGVIDDFLTELKKNENIK